MRTIDLMGLDFKHLKYVSAIAACGSVTRAAEALFIAPPNLSRAVGELEEFLGFTLFVRTKKGMIPTPEGERFIAASDSMMASYEKLIAECRNETENRFSFACVPSSLFVNVLLNVSETQTGCRLSSREYSNSPEFFQSVVRERTDAGLLIIGKTFRETLLSYIEEKGLSYHYLAESPLYLTLSGESPLLCGSGPCPIDLSRARLIANVAYYDPLGIRLDKLPYPLPDALSTQNGSGRAANLDILDTMKDHVMLSCRLHSRILTRNHLVSYPYQPQIPVYEYGYVVKSVRRFPDGWARVMEAVQQELNREFSRNP